MNYSRRTAHVHVGILRETFVGCREDLLVIANRGVDDQYLKMRTALSVAVFKESVDGIKI
ncbi:hypothetical protein N7527_006463 [Penicillium freii]|nr:hypothetical protein N7527_006463 [Penicillium freii]